jgi:hypothetical protein
MAKPRKLPMTEVKKLGNAFGCLIETELHMSIVGLIDRQVQNIFIVCQGKRYFAGLGNVAGHYLRLWDWETGLAIDVDWNKVFQHISGVEGIVQQSLWEVAQ